MAALLSRTFLLACLLVSPAAMAQTYPDRNVTIVVTSSAGALTDVLTRAVAQQLSEKWKQGVIVENKGGAGYAIAAQAVMRAEHDGYTLLASETGIYTTQPHLYAPGKLSYDAEKDFIPVAGYGTIPAALLINPSLPANSVSDVIALAKKKPGALTFGTAGVGTAPPLWNWRTLPASRSRRSTIAARHRRWSISLPDISTRSSWDHRWR
ncbi:MAG TPA: tripartite tricarboxylate transporter substrate binding protein [Xanthobacteraceae bacterium]|nr:tripartite tricarboxylate transporter substrate binding protein [Xanthobacteraceae bacterium]